MKRIFCIIFGAMLLLCACGSDKEEERSIKNSHELNAETGDKSENGKVIVFEAEDITLSKSDLKNAAEILRARLDNMGYTEAIVSAEDDCITVEIAEKTNLEELAESLGATAQLNFTITTA